VVGKQRKLGRGLDALLGAAARPTQVAIDEDDRGAIQAGDTSLPSGEHLRRIPLEYLQRGKYQPRRDFDQAALEELAESIRAQGVMQPIVVRPIDEKRFEIIAGERRWRASQIAGVDKIPAVVREVSDEAAIAMALIENIQRENLNAIEEATALKRLQSEFELSQQQVAQAVGKSRPVIANLLRLLSLELDVQTMIEHGQLDTGHGKVLLALEGAEQLRAAKQVVNGRLSVRQTEALVKGVLADPNQNATKIDPDIKRLEQDLSARLGASVAINHSGSGKGKLVVTYTNLDELDGILSRIK
jgi:ParB family chromosome partitioning protein